MFIYRWNGLPANSFLDFCALRENGHFCDVKILVGSICLPAHRIILAASIPYFRAMFRFNVTGSAEEEISLPEIDAPSLKSLIDFVYSAELSITITNAQALLATSVYLQLDEVTDACFQFLSKRLNPNNVIMTRAFADSVNNLGLMENADLYIVENFDDVSMSKDFLRLSFLYVKDLIRRDELNVQSEEIVFEAIMRWAKFDSDRYALLPKLLEDVRLPLLPPEYITKRISSEELISSSSSCVEIIEEAKNFLLNSDNSPTPCRFSTKERYSSRKHHLKCAKIMGCGMYGACKRTDEKICLYYHDSVHDKWAALYRDDDFERFEFLVCTENRVYFLHQAGMRIFHLKTLERAFVAYAEEFNISEAGVALHDGQIYFMGGGCNSPNEISCFSPQQNICQKVGKMAVTRTSPSAVSLGEYIYIVGGFCDNQTLGSAERYNPETGGSTEISSLLVKGCDYGCCALSYKIYVCGGVRFDGSASSIAQMYNPETDHWSFITPMHTALKSMSLVAYADRLLAIEDVCVPGDGFAIQIYDPNCDEWTSGKRVSCSTKVEELVVVVTNSAWRIKVLLDY